MKASRCLDCAYLHPLPSPAKCLVCGSTWLQPGSRGDLDTAWLAHRAAYPRMTPTAKMAWMDTVVYHAMEAKAERSLWVPFGFVHLTYLDGRIVGARTTAYDLCHWG